MLPLSLLLLRYHKSPASPINETNPKGARIIHIQLLFLFPTSNGNLFKINYIVGLYIDNQKTKEQLT